nr:unnamed protein product [uncultured bacterium]
MGKDLKKFDELHKNQTSYAKGIMVIGIIVIIIVILLILS